MERHFTDADLDRFIEKIEERNAHQCRFASIPEEDLRASVDFYKNLNQAYRETNSVARKTIVTIVITSAFALLGWGFVSKIKTALGG